MSTTLRTARRWLGDHLVLFYGLLVLLYMFVPVAVVIGMSFNEPAGRQSYVNTLLDRWAAARGHGGRISVQIVDVDGQVLLERTRP